MREAFGELYGRDPTVVARAPGRVNLIGEHTDYNDGFVLPLAIDRAIWFATSPRDDDQVCVRSVDFDQTCTFALDGLAGLDGLEGPVTWIEYVRGSLWALARAGGLVQGFDAVLTGDVPVGAGLSSSAALEIATLRASTALTGSGWDAARMALLGQKAENEWVGMNCGIMDQMISAAGRADHALLIDCRSLQTHPVALPAGTVAVVMDTGTRRGLVDSEYNARRARCEEAARVLGVPALRDVSVETLETRAADLDPMARKRARHVVTENVRTRKAARTSDPAALGRLMDASHESLRDDFEVSTAELNTMVELAREATGCFGARMTGAGFGGCAVALVRGRDSDAFIETVAARYEARTAIEPSLFATKAAAGATVVA